MCCLHLVNQPLTYHSTHVLCWGNQGIDERGSGVVAVWNLDGVGVVWLLTKAKQHEACAHRRWSDCSPTPQPMEWPPPRAPTPIRWVLPPAPGWSWLPPSALPTSDNNIKFFGRSPNGSGSEVQGKERNASLPRRARGEERRPHATRMAASLPGGSDAVVEMYRAALLAPDVNKSRSGSKGQKRSAKGKKGKVCSYTRMYVCVCVCSGCGDEVSNLCYCIHPQSVGWIGAGVSSMCL